MTPALILAAGASSRLGQPKQLLRLHHETLLDRTLRLTREAGCTPILILGAHADLIRSTCDLSTTSTLLNPDWPEGMASSIRHGLAAIPPDASELLILACDQPSVTSAHLRALIEATQSSHAPTASSYASRRGVPACFPRSSFSALAALTGDTGARTLLAHASTLPLPHGELDIDTPADLRKFGSNT